MPLRLRHATEADALAISEVNCRAFRDTISKILFPPHMRLLSETDEEIPWRAARTIKRMRDGNIMLVVVDTPDDSQDAPETIVGMANWAKPVGKAASAPVPPSAGGEAGAVPVADDPAPATLDSEALDRFMKQLDAEAIKALGPDGSKHMWCERCPEFFTVLVSPNQIHL